MRQSKHSQEIIRDIDESNAYSQAINRLLADIESLKSEIWVLRTTLFISVIGLIMLTVSHAFGG